MGIKTKYSIINTDAYNPLRNITQKNNYQDYKSENCFNYNSSTQEYIIDGSIEVVVFKNNFTKMTYEGKEYEITSRDEYNTF